MDTLILCWFGRKKKTHCELKTSEQGKKWSLLISSVLTASKRMYVLIPQLVLDQW